MSSGISRFNSVRRLVTGLVMSSTLTHVALLHLFSGPSVFAQEAGTVSGTASDTKVDEKKKKERQVVRVRASEIDPTAKEHPEVGFVFSKDGKPADIQVAAVDPSVPSTGKLVIWLMGYSEPLFQRLTGYGHHAIQIHYANGWFSKLNKEPPPDDQYLGRIRLEAAIGEDVSEAIDIPKPDSIVGRTQSLLKWLRDKHPEAGWGQFLDANDDVVWDKVILSGASHGSTTSARFALHQKVNRVVMLSGPRDQLENWYSLPSATPKDRFFAFTHELDAGWSRDHYPRSWRLLGLGEFGPIVDVDKFDQKTSEPLFSGSHQLISSADVGGKVDRAHGASVPGNSAVKNDKGEFIHEAVWKYLFLE